MKFLLIVLVVASPAILYGIALLGIAIRNRCFPKRCPVCRIGVLQAVNGIRETYPTGKGTGTFYICSDCAKRFFWSNDGQEYQDSSGHEFDHWYNKSIGRNS